MSDEREVRGDALTIERIDARNALPSETASAPTESVPDQGAGQRYVGRRLRAAERRKREDGRGRGRPRPIAIMHAGKSAMLSARLDGRTREAKFERRIIAARVAHCGGEQAVTEPLLSAIVYSARLELLSALAWAALRRTGHLTATGEPSGALSAFLSVGRELREALKSIGMERRERTAPSLDDYLHNRIEPGDAPATEEGQQ